MGQLRNTYRIGIIGSTEATMDDNRKVEVYEKCYELGKLLSKIEGHIIYTGACDGYSREVIKGVYENGGITVGIYPNLYYQSNLEIDNYVRIPIFSGLGYGIREVVMLRSVECVIAIGGGPGTLSEMINAYYSYLPMMVLTNTGGCSNIVADTYLDKNERVKIVSYETPEKIVRNIVPSIAEYRERHEAFHGRKLL